MKKVLYLFGSLTDSDIDWLVANGSVERAVAGTTLLTEGGENDAIFIVLEGSVSVRTGAAGEVTRLEWGEVIGEMSLVDGRPASATVAAVAETKLLKIPRARLEAQLQQNLGFSSRFFRAVSVTLSERLRSTMRRMSPAKDETGELSAGLLDAVYLAGARFDRLVKATLSR